MIATTDAETASSATGRRTPLTPWELPSLLTSVHRYRYRKRRVKRERKHFPAILGFVYRNRFAVASQIQRRFADALRSGRTARRHLEELESLGYLGVISGRGLGPLFPKVYYVTGRGVKKLQESLAAQGKPWKAVRVDRHGRHSLEGYSAEHVVHEILVTEFLLAVRQTIEARPDLELLKTERRSLARHPSFRVSLGSRTSRLIPDAMFLFRQQGGGMICSFIEMDMGTMNQKQIRAKYHRYLAWAESVTGRQFLVDFYRRHGAAEPRPTFRILIIASSRTGKDDDRRIKELHTAAAKLPEAMRKRLWITTVADLRRRQHHLLPLNEAMWHRGQCPPQSVGLADQLWSLFPGKAGQADCR